MNTKKNLFQYFLECITKKYFKFSGRATRNEFIGFIGFTLGLLIFARNIEPLSLVKFSIHYFDLNISGIILLLLLIPLFAVSVRRFHDINLSRIIVIILLCGILFLDIIFLIVIESVRDLNPALIRLRLPIKIISYVSILIYLTYSLKKGYIGPNKYGPDPLNPELEHELDQLGQKKYE